ncbi:galactofuranosyltransferase [Dulcicalothrix desertica PCC 7102]|uniref:Galactofuranosyltransferase n=1 Tax=Dulcicalothrix desertica PCC 7102 TaxID=232991 RepID=A0A433VFD0_9CYAN|nr:glycosyltransferase [Dulcicalothrix desertica]RUT04800.1 galactofuranosyltransferase [Dulcicalothrix desertica PCC 7102]TWH42811.1 galactofuranosylgalactofuranosylrhamnosyl-N-acetylglucosaminyl-diphospho-decaprenol beta-1,5/1,6-galactofuranosyltransferase [Dulcicalothrix desertica PCC 7102]
MQVVSRLQLPKTSETADLYVKLDGNTQIDFDAGKIILHQGSTISFNTYFNSIYENYYTKYTTLNELQYRLKLEGAFEILVYREREKANTRELIYSEKIQHTDFLNYVDLALPLSAPDAGRIYLEIKCLSETGYFAEGVLVTQQEKQRDITLAIITCTFKKEIYVKKTVDLVTQDNLLQNKKFQFFVVDNGKTLNQSDFPSDRVTLLPNRNLGGSGGFAKGLLEALQSGLYTHYLFMDDDIELDSEVIYKLFPLYEYAKQDFAIAGGMLDLYRKCILHEAGALYNKYTDDEGNRENRDFNITSLKKNTDLSDPNNLNLFLVEDQADYGAFWFFAFSHEVVENIGLPLPFFIKIDDVEFGLRVKQYLNNAIVPFPSLAVWHEPFYAKNPIWDIYYTLRNVLIANTMHGYLEYWATLKTISGGMFYNLLLFNYNSAQMHVKAFEDYLKGPDFIKKNDSEALHNQISASVKNFKSQQVISSSEDVPKDYQITKVGKLQKLMTLITLNGHLLPPFMIRNESAFIHYPEEMTKRDSICKAFSKRKIIIKYSKLPALYHNELDNKAAFNILSTWIKSIIKSTFGWSRITKQWKQASKELASTTFWQNYLNS